MELFNLEFFGAPDGTVYIRDSLGQISKLEYNDIEFINEILQRIEDLYPVAYKALCKCYASSSMNVVYFHYLMVHRFIRCNFNEDDTFSKDINSKGYFNFEQVKCPMRGECTYEGCICGPKMDSSLSEREIEVGELMLDGKDIHEIAESLFISPYTVRRHLDNMKKKLSLSSTHQLINYFHARDHKNN